MKTKYLLSISSLTVFRDNKSQKRALEMNIRNTYEVEDLSYLFFNEFNGHQKIEVDNNYILVTWRNLIGYLPFEQEMLLMNKLVDNIEKLIMEKKYDKVILSALDTNFDVDSCRYLYAKLLEKGIKTSYDIDSTIRNITLLIKNASFHFSGRLHGSVASEFYGTPTLSLSYSPKMDYFYDSINADNYINVYKDKVHRSLIEKVMNNKDEMKVKDIEEKYQDAELNLKHLDDFVRSQ
jgi:polysaccharide pyruvyl transferase WcaK-like protein